MSGSRNALLGDWFQPPADPQANVLLRQMPLAPRPSYADAADQAWATIQAKLEEQQHISQERGLWTGGQVWDGGHPTVKGVADAAQQYAGTFEGGIKAFHGSPHSFERFDTSKIGTGEGAQAYGHGMYFAENEGVARSYRDQLARPDEMVVHTNEGPVSAGSFMEDLTPHGRAAFLVAQNNGDVSAALARASALDKTPYSGEMWRPVIDELSKNPGTYQGKTWQGAGHMYEVDINADPERMLHWDKPLSEQSQYVRDALQIHKDLGGRQNWDDRATGAEVYNQIAGDRQDAASQLRFLGIPGIRYLDQNSRAAGEGTHNVVVFDANTIDILRKYGIAGLGIGLGATATQGSE